ncbi:MAG: hypothetical protein P9L97_06280 [Candidatus Tenebribacter davisii]|nr:hypothetical protein [Candidatus Tenebribacter davisii]
MGFRDRMAKSGGSKSLGKRHNQGTKSTGGGRFPTIFNKDKVPEGVEFWKCKEGEHIVDIIPFEAGPDMPFDERLQPVTEEGNLDYVLDLFVHTNVGEMLKPYVCPHENFGEPCPICEFMKANKLDKDDWKNLVAKHRVVYFLWVHDNREEERKGIQIHEASHFFMEANIEAIAKLPKGGGFVKFSDPDSGRSLAWTRKGASMTNTTHLGHRLVERDSPIPNKILDLTFPLDSIVNMHPDYAEIEKEFRGTLKKMKLLDEPDGPGDAEDNPWADDESTDIDDSGFGDDKEEDTPTPPKRKRPADRTKPSGSDGTTVKRKRRKR